MVTLIYENALHIGPESAQSSAALTLMRSDVDRIQNALLEIHEAWATILELGILTYLLARQVGWTCIAPIIVTVSKY